MNFVSHVIARSLIITIIIVIAASRLSADDEKSANGRPQRVLWTESRVVGFPDPPPPFQKQRAFPNLQPQKPLSVTVLPGTEDLLVTVHSGDYGGPGRLLRISRDESTSDANEFLKIDDIIYGIAFHPKFSSNGYMFVGCNGRSEVLDATATRVLRYHVSRTAPFKCDPSSATVIIEWKSNGHNGGDLVFGHDGMLYVSAGDGTSDSDGNLAGQDLSTIPGSMIRIDVDRPADDKPYSIPSDNPFLEAAGARPEIWAYGLRNPWRISVDAKTGDLWVGNNGQDLWETVHVIRRGENHGWSITEGSHPFQLNRKKGPTEIVAPTIEHPHSEARSLTGGHVYYGSKYPTLHGHYIYGDYSTGMIWAAKYDGGKVTSHFLVARTSLQISGFGIDHDGELLIVDYGTGLYRLIPNEQPSDTNFPRRLSQTGIYESVQNHIVKRGLIAYEVNSPLWSDGAAKERFIGLPGDASIGFKPSGSWEFPNGTVLVKTFSLPLSERPASALTRIETRLMTRHNGEWFGYSYEWNEEQTDAILVEAAGRHVEFTVTDDRTTSDRRQSWYFPSRSDCMVCHSRAANYVLGLSTSQTNRDAVIDGESHSQLDHFQGLKLFRSFKENPPDHQTAGVASAVPETAEFELPTLESELPHLANPQDVSLPLEFRVRSYLDSNCAQCHVNAGGGNSKLELPFSTPLEKTGLLNELPQHDAFGIADARIVAPGHPERSLLLHRLQHRGRGQMPPLASSVVDRHAVNLLTEWIRSLPESVGAATNASMP